MVKKNQDEMVLEAFELLKDLKPRNAVNAFAFLYPDGSRKVVRDGACYNQVPASKAGASVFCTATTRYDQANDPKKVKEYIAMMISKDTPYWADLISKQDFDLTVGEHEVWTPEFIYDYGFIFTNLNVPANLIIQFCINMRLVWEGNATFKTWCELTDHGIDPWTAFCYSGVAQVRGPSTGIQIGWPGHAAFNSNHFGSLLNLKHLINRDLNKDEFLEPLAETTQYRKCNNLFFFGDLRDQGATKTELLKAIKQVEQRAKGEVKKAKEFPRFFPVTTSITRPKVVDQGATTVNTEHFITVIKEGLLFQ